jgi:hypothetical protein
LLYWEAAVCFVVASFRHGKDQVGDVVVDVDWLVGDSVAVDEVGRLERRGHGGRRVGDIFISDVGGIADMKRVIAFRNEEEMELAVGASYFGRLHFGLVVGIAQTDGSTIEYVSIVRG